MIQHTLVDGIHQQVAAFKEGFSTIFPVNELNIFTPEELVLLFGDPYEDWSSESQFETEKREMRYLLTWPDLAALRDALTADHGYSLDAPTVANLIEILSAYDHKQRRDFLQL